MRTAIAHSVWRTLSHGFQQFGEHIQESREHCGVVVQLAYKLDDFSSKFIEQKDNIPS